MITLVKGRLQKGLLIDANNLLCNAIFNFSELNF